MIDTLDPLVGRCPHLTTLRLAVLGPCDESEVGSREERLYMSWARFLDSVRETLLELYYEQEYSYNEQRLRDDFPKPDFFPRPMDRLFARHILPVLVEAPWPRMHIMDIKGVGGNVSGFSSRTIPFTKEELNS